MIVTKIFIIFSTIFLINSSISTNSINISLNRNQNLLKSVCKIARDVISSSNETQDILIGNNDAYEWSTFVEDIQKCISGAAAVIVTDLKIKMLNVNLRKASMIIATFDVINEPTVLKLIKEHNNSTIFHHMAKIICIVSSSVKRIHRTQALGYFLDLGHLNVAIVHESSTGDIIYEIIHSVRYRGRVLENPENFESVFPDKLMNLEGFAYKIPIYYQPPVVDVINTLVFAPMMLFLNAVGVAQNAVMNMIFLQNYVSFYPYWYDRKMHLTINTAVDMASPNPKLQTYDKKSYCALVPIPPNASYFSIIFIKPFDVLIWLLFVLSIVSSVAVWRMFRGHGAVDSHWHLAFGIFTMFIGQGAEFSRRNRFVLAFLLNIICLSVFLLSNLYEGEITASMIEPAYENRLKTVDDLLNSNYPISSSGLFAYTIRNSSLMSRMSHRLNSSGLLMGFDNGKPVIEQHFVFIRTCIESRNTLREKLENGKFVSEYYYILPEELLWQYVQLEASYLNPFIYRFQYYMDLCFQAGLPHMWKVMAYQDHSEFMKPQSRDAKDFLELQDLGSVFGVLLIGLGLSGFVLLGEIFVHDCITQLNFSKIICIMRNWLRNIFVKCQRKKSIKVRKIFVRPSQRL